MEKQQKQNSFLIMASWEDAIELLSDEEKGKFLIKLFHWHKGEFIKFETPMLEMLWKTIEPTLTINREKWLENLNRKKQ